MWKLTIRGWYNLKNIKYTDIFYRFFKKTIKEAYSTMRNRADPEGDKEQKNGCL